MSSWRAFTAFMVGWWIGRLLASFARVAMACRPLVRLARAAAAGEREEVI